LFKGSLGRLVDSDLDAVEVMNSSALPFGCSVKKAERLASNLGLARVAGSDAHYGPEIGFAYTLVDAEPNAGEIAKAVEKGLCQPFGEAIPLSIRLKREALVTMRKFNSLF
jgi:predicted metal-dependent phosphoesterase TrpH